MEAREKVLQAGYEHPDTLISLGNLAKAPSRQRNYEEADAINRREVEARQEVLQVGYEHPDTLSSLGGFRVMLSKLFARKSTKTKKR